MNDQGLQSYPGYAGSGGLVANRNKVLRNTYWLLALSLLPTVAGAWLGLATGITRGLGGGVYAVPCGAVTRRSRLSRCCGRRCSRIRRYGGPPARRPARR